MKLISHVSLRLSIAITLILSIWAVLFYFTMIDEINDEMDDSLEDYSETIIIRALSGEQLPSKNNGSNNQYYLTRISEETALSTPNISYADSMVYIHEKRETEPARILTTIFCNEQNEYFKLVVSAPSIEKADLQGFTCEEITAMGLMVRFHHKKFPGPKDSRLAGMSREDAFAVRVCAMILKMADVMDRHRNNSVRSARMRIDGGRLILSLSADEDPSMEIWSLERIRPDFQKLFGLDLVPVSVDPMTPVPARDGAGTSPE